MDEFAVKPDPFLVISDSGVEYVVIPYSSALVSSPAESSELYSIIQYRLADGEPVLRLADDTFRLDTGERARIKGIAY